MDAKLQEEDFLPDVKIAGSGCVQLKENLKTVHIAVIMLANYSQNILTLILTPGKDWRSYVRKHKCLSEYL